MANPPFKQQDLKVHKSWNISDRDLPEIRSKAKDKVAQAITKPGRDQHIKNAQLRRETLAAALREVEKTTPLKAGLKYIKDNVQPELPKHLPTDYRLPSEGELKGVVSKMKRGQL
jgi:hypothetical protein